MSVRSGAVRLRLSRLDGLNNYQNVSLDVAHLLPLLLLLLPFLLLLLPPIAVACGRRKYMQFVSHFTRQLMSASAH